MVEMGSHMPFSLNEDETVITSIKPVWTGYLLRYSILHLIAAIFLAVIIAGNLVTALASQSVSLLLILAIFVIILLLILLVSVIAAKISYGKFMVWLTNQRIVSARGLIGYNIESLPIENIVDVVLNRSITDRMLGLSSVTAVPMGGMMMYGRSSARSTVGFIPALNPDDAVKIQKQIFDLRNARKKTPK